MFRDINEAQYVLTDPEKRKLYDSGAMHADSEGFSGFQQGNMGDFSNMGGFSMEGNGQTFTFRMNGQQMEGIDPLVKYLPCLWAVIVNLEKKEKDFDLLSRIQQDLNKVKVKKSKDLVDSMVSGFQDAETFIRANNQADTFSNI